MCCGLWVEILNLDEYREKWHDKASDFKSAYQVKHMELSYYCNRSGLVAVSYDEGNNIILPTGRIIELIDTWEEVSDDCHGDLNEEQLRILSRMQITQRTDLMGHIINQYSRDRREVERRDGTGDNHNYKIREVPEGALVVSSSFNQKD